MQRIFAAIALLVIFGGIGYFYINGKTIQNPEKIYEHAQQIPNFDKAVAYISGKVEHWQPDPEDPAVRIPKNWGKSEVTLEGKTFIVYSPDQTVPPRYYISFAFPKTLVKKVAAIRCWGTAKDKPNDVCIVGNDPKVEAYFQILKLFKTPDFSSLAPNIQMQ